MDTTAPEKQNRTTGRRKHSLISTAGAPRKDRRAFPRPAPVGQRGASQRAAARALEWLLAAPARAAPDVGGVNGRSGGRPLSCAAHHKTHIKIQ